MKPTKIELFLACFPLKGILTEEILNTARAHDPLHCRGAVTLRNALGNDNLNLTDDNIVIWGRTYGLAYVGGLTIVITTVEKLDFMDANTQSTVTFIAEIRK